MIRHVTYWIIGYQASAGCRRPRRPKFSNSLFPSSNSTPTCGDYNDGNEALKGYENGYEGLKDSVLVSSRSEDELGRGPSQDDQSRPTDPWPGQKLYKVYKMYIAGQTPSVIIFSYYIFGWWSLKTILSPAGRV